jgi:pSer/pThr/pTyr-binding forkhead associated (FHA) protein
MPLRLIIEDDEGTTTIVPLASDAITIGRQQGNTIQLTEKNVSRRHARLFPESDGWIIEDLNSYNGIKVNGQSAEGRLALKEGDVIQIGDYHLALTEDVDKRTLNYDGREAANNDPGAEPMLASSSSDLPQLSPEELAALSSGPQTPQPAAMLMDSGPVPAATGLPASYADDSPRKKNTGMLVVAGVVVVGVVIGVGVWLNGGDKPPPRKDNQVATSADSSGSKATPASGNNSLVANPPGSPGDNPRVDPLPEDDSAGAEPTNDSVAEPVPVDDPSGDVPGTNPAPDGGKKNNTKKTNNTKKRPKTAKQPPKPPQPTADPDELLLQARKLQYQNPRKAYELAKQSYGLKRSQDTLYVMAFAACRMGDAGKARKAISQLKKGRETMIESCSKQGIDI